MPGDFDPYFTWLGIPREEQPPTHYRLLGLPPLTADPDVIQNAVDQRMAHVRSMQAGQRAALAQQLLNHLATAQVCLLDPEKKRAYDAALRAPTPQHQPVIVAEVVDAPPRPPSITPRHSAASVPAPTRALGSRTRLAATIAAAAAALVLVVVAIYVFTRPPPQPVRGNGQAATTPAGLKPEDVAEPSGSGGDAALDPASLVVPAPFESFATPVPPLARTSTDSSAKSAEQGQRADTKDLFPYTDSAPGTVGQSAVSPEMQELVLGLQAKSYEEKLAALAEVQRATTSAADARLAATELLDAMKQADAAGQGELARPHAGRLLNWARRSGDADLERQATILILKMRES